MCSGTTDFDRLSATYSYVDHGTRMTLSSMFCLYASSQLWGSHGGAVLDNHYVHSGYSSLTLTHLIHEYHVDIPWNSVPSCGFRGAPLVAKY